MDLGSNKKLFVQDKEVDGVKDKEMIRKKDAQERDEFTKRLLERDKDGKSKTTKHQNHKGVTLSEEEKIRLLPELR